MVELLVYAASCEDCGRVGGADRAWDSPAAAPSPLPRCRCGAMPTLRPLDVNELALRASMGGFVASSCVSTARAASV